MPNASSGRLRLRTRTDDSCPGFERSNVFWSPGVYPPRDSVPARMLFLPSSGYLQRPPPANWRRSMRRTKLAAVISESSPVRYWAAATVPAPPQIRTRPNPLRAGIRRREDRTKYWREPTVGQAWQRRARYAGARRGDRGDHARQAQLRRDMFQKLHDLQPLSNTTDGRFRQPHRSPGDDGSTGAREPGRLLAVPAPKVYETLDGAAPRAAALRGCRLRIGGRRAGSRSGWSGGGRRGAGARRGVVRAMPCGARAG